MLEKIDTLEEAVQEGETALRQAKEQNALPTDLPRIYYPLLSALAGLQRDEPALIHAQDCYDAVPTYPDSLLFLAWAHYVRRRWQQTCEFSRLFLELQDKSLSNPEEFLCFENMTKGRINSVLLRWTISEANLGHEEQAQKLLERMLKELEANDTTKAAVTTLMGSGFMSLAGRMARRICELEPDWDWPPLAARTADLHLNRQQLDQCKTQGLQALEAGDWPAAERFLDQARGIDEMDPEILLGLGKALHRQGREPEAVACLSRGVNAHPGFAWAWQLLAEERFASHDHAGALAYYQRALALVPDDQKMAARLEVCRKRLAQAPPQPTVGQNPPKLLVILAGGLSPEMVRMPTPHFLMHRAWGELVFGPQEAGLDHPAWATLYTGREALAHGLRQEGTRQHPLSLVDLAVPSVWEVMAATHRVGLLAAPLGHPGSQGLAWTVAGRPSGLLSPQLVSAPELLPPLLTLGYRSDQVLNDMEGQTFPQLLLQDVRQEAFLFQTERNKVAAALALPAVEVLVVGFTALDYFQQAFGISNYHTFAAYQQIYAIIEMLVHSLRPQHFAVLSQRSYAHQENHPRGQGFYCLSWLKGENRRAQAGDIAPQLLQLLGLDPGLLDAPRA